jgi:CRISPR-associated protein Csm2
MAEYNGQSRNYGNQNRHPEQRVGAMPDFKLIKLSKPLDPELFNQTAKTAAEKIAQDQKTNKPTQLRRFYDELVLWETRASQQPGKFAEFLPFIRMINAKAAYAEGRKLVNADFVSLIRHTLAEVRDPETLNHCKLFWEAFMGFYKQVRPKD